MNKNLIVARSGDKSLHPNWLSGANPNFDLVVTYYGDSAPREWATGDYRVIPIKGPKWRGLYEYFTTNSQWHSYDNILLPDDDLMFDGALINRFFSLVDKYKAPVSQPALDNKSFWSHAVTLASKSFECRVTNYVEIMCPCLSTRFLEKVLPLFVESTSGWGMEFYWTRLLAASDMRLPMIFDCTPITHTRPVGQANHGTDGQVSPHHEITSFFKKYNLTGERGITLAGVLATGEVLDGERERNELAVYLVRDAISMNKEMTRSASERMDKAAFTRFIDSIVADVGQTCPWVTNRKTDSVVQLSPNNGISPRGVKFDLPPGPEGADLAHDLQGRSFRFGRVDNSFICELTLMADGSISGSQHDNERFWSVKDGQLVFRSISNVTTTKFDGITQNGAGYLMSGEFIPRGPGAWHTLTEIPDKTPPSVIAEIVSELYGGHSPCSYANVRYVDNGYPHTNAIPEIISAILDIHQPQFWLELGSMIGGSAILVAGIVKTKEAATEIICIDPFTGDVNMWAWEQPKRKIGEWQFLRLERGKPTIYERFLANIAAAGHADIILPIAATSIVGIKLLRRLANEHRLSSLPNVIYLDSAHEPDETFLELQNCWHLLEPGGVLMGDDWSWPAVQTDVIKFAKTVRMDSEGLRRLAVRHARFKEQDGILLDQGQWVLVKGMG
jgi:predicted O-methyltransferase YrrM